MRKKRILIVDDDREVQNFLRKRLGFYGLECISVFSVEAALEQLRDMSPDLVLLDLGFQKVDGTAFLQHAREWLGPDEKVPPVIVLSCHNAKDIVDYVLEAGAAGFISKPFESDELMSVVREYL